MQIILASASPRRQELLKNIFTDFTVHTSTCDEVAVFRSPQQYVMDLAEQKAIDVAQHYPLNESSDISSNRLIIGADTIVYHEGQILGKPRDKEDAFHMISSLSGKEHEVYTGISFVVQRSNQQFVRNFYCLTKVAVSTLSDSEIEAYLNTSEPYDKAGSYGIQGYFSRHISGLKGDYFNVVGLPLNKLYEALKSLDLI